MAVDYVPEAYKLNYDTTVIRLPYNHTTKLRLVFTVVQLSDAPRRLDDGSATMHAPAFAPTSISAAPVCDECCHSTDVLVFDIQYSRVIQYSTVQYSTVQIYIALKVA